MVSLVEIGIQGLVGHPHDTAYVLVALLLRTAVEILQRIQAEQIEHQTVGNNIATLHRLPLDLVIEIGIEGIVLAKVLVERDAHDALANNDALPQCSYLRIDQRHLHFGKHLEQTTE